MSKKPALSAQSTSQTRNLLTRSITKGKAIDRSQLTSSSKNPFVRNQGAAAEVQAVDEHGNLPFVIQIVLIILSI